MDIKEGVCQVIPDRINIFGLEYDIRERIGCNGNKSETSHSNREALRDK